MNFTFQLLLLVATTVAALPCKKMIWKDSTGVTNDVMETGLYTVKTTRRTGSAEVQDLISRLDGATNIQYKHNSFTAVLQPKDLKKVCI